MLFDACFNAIEAQLASRKAVEKAIRVNLRIADK
jgi:hypothetical protein